MTREALRVFQNALANLLYPEQSEQGCATWQSPLPDRIESRSVGPEPEMIKTTGTGDRDCGRSRAPYKVAVGVSSVIGSTMKLEFVLRVTRERFFGGV